MGKYDSLKLENQLCFPLYACAKEIVRRYNPLLEEFNTVLQAKLDDGSVAAIFAEFKSDAE